MPMQKPFDVERLEKTLLPCPFCGSKAELVCSQPTGRYPGWDSDHFWFVRCLNTGCFCYKGTCKCLDDMERPVAVWNSRAETIEQPILGKRVVAMSWLPMPGFDALFNLESITLEGGIKLEVWASDSRESVCAWVKELGSKCGATEPMWRRQSGRDG